MKYLIILALLGACNCSKPIADSHYPPIVLNDSIVDDSSLSSQFGSYDSTTAMAQLEEDENDTVVDIERICYDSLLLEICTYPSSWQWYYFKGKCNVADTMNAIIVTFTPDKPKSSIVDKPKGNLDVYLHSLWEYKRRWDSLRDHRIKDRL